MKTTTNYSLAFAILFLVAVNTKADTVLDLQRSGVQLYVGASERDAYTQNAGATEWALVGAAEFEKEKAPYKDFFTLQNVNDKSIESQQGSYTLDTYNGMGAGYAQALTGTDNYGGMQFSHNSANTASLSMPDGLLNSFFFDVGTHADLSSTKGTFDITIHTNLGDKTYRGIPFGFLGFILGEDEYLIGFDIKTNGNKNTGFWFDFVPGSGIDPFAPEATDPTATPEPATLAIIGLGLAGLGLTRRRMKS